MASIISSMVITLVTLAGGSFSWAFCSYSTVPVAMSISRALFPATSILTAATRAGSSPTVRHTASKIHTRFISDPSEPLVVQPMRHVRRIDARFFRRDRNGNSLRRIG